MSSNIQKLYLIRFLVYCHFVAAVLVPFFTDWGGILLSRVLWLNSWFMICIFLFEIPTGSVADFLSRKTSIILGCALAGCGYLLYASYPHILIFLAAETVLAVSFTLLSGADEALAYDTLVELDRTGGSKQVFARMESFKLAGIVAGGITGSVIAGRYGLRAPFLVQGIPMVLALAVSLTLKEPPVAKRESAGQSYLSILTSGARFFIGHRILRILALDMMAVSSLAWLIIWLYQPLLELAGVKLSWFGSVHALMSLAQIAILTQVGRLEKLLGTRKRLLWTGAFLTGFSFLMLGLVKSVAPVIIFIVMAAGFGLSRRPLFSSYMNRYIPSGMRATVLSAASMFNTLGIAVVNLCAGAVADISVRGTMIVVGIALLGFSFLSRIREEHLLEQVT